MEENQKHSKILVDCAEISELISNNKLIINSEVTVHINSHNYPHLLDEMEEYIKIRVDRTQSKISLKITDTEFIFIKT